MYRGAIAAAVDADGDGRISRAEYAAQIAGAAGGVADPHATLRWLAASFPGNLPY